MSAQGRRPPASTRERRVTAGSSAGSPPRLHHPHRWMGTLRNYPLPAKTSSVRSHRATCAVPSCTHGCTEAGPILVARWLAVKLSPRGICRMGGGSGGRVRRLGKTRLRVPGPGTTCLPPSLGTNRVSRSNLAPPKKRLISPRPGRDVSGG